MNIKIIGSNTDKCIILQKRVFEAVSMIDDNVTIILVNKSDEINKYQLRKYPGLMINENIATEGRIISTREIVKRIKNQRR